MTLNTATILNYKNIAEARLEFSPKLNCLIGNNGQGKTNVLDAIYYLSMCRSYAASTDNSAVIRHGEPYMMLQGNYTRCETPLEVSVALQRGKRKVVRRDGKEYQRLSQHIGLLPVVMVSPMDWDLVRGSGEERRRFMDLIISQNDSEYLDALIRYNKAVEQRNAMIKKEMTDPLLYETVEMEMDYDSEKYSFVVIEDEFPSYSGDSHVAVVYGEDFNMQLEYAAYYKGEDFAGHVKTLGEKYQGIAPVRFGGVEGIRFIDGDNVCLALPIPNDASSFLLVTLMKNPGYDEDVSTLPDHPDLRYMLGTLRFTLH